jgi:VCBS repeat-containing protein
MSGIGAGAFAGRLCPFAAALGVGAAIAVSGAAVASASPVTPDASSSANSEHAAADAPSGRAKIGRQPGGTRDVEPRRATARSNAVAAVPNALQPPVRVRTVAHAATLRSHPSTARHQLSANATASDPVGAFFSNQTPVLRPAQTGQSTAGVVSGQLNASDPDSSPLTYNVSQTPVHGSVVVSATGGYTYTPDPAVAGTGISDSFRVSVSDASNGFHIHGLVGLINLLTFGLIGSSGHTGIATVAVTVAPFTPGNRGPVLGVPSVGVPNATTGVVSGSVSATDPDGDTLSYSAPTTTAKGGVSINASTGAFSYTPTVAARNTAATPGATAADRADGFTVTVVDGRGGTASTAVTVAVSPTPGAPTPLAAFPGAEGFGADATGGRGGSVIYVTNLNADGAGSLQWAIDQSGAKYILFKVSGLIDTQIHLTNGNVTIAGQTSPGGITIRGLVTDESPYQDQAVQAPEDFAENWILQHIRIRPGLTAPGDDGLRLRYTRNAIVDHVSIGNAIDEAIEISYSNNITVQNTIIAETVGGHSFYGGVLMNYSNPAYGFGLDNVSLHHNVFNRIEGRLPEGSRESAAAANSFMNLELSNNLYWDPRFFIALAVDSGVASGGARPIYWKLNAVNNLFHTANSFQYGMFDDQILNVARNELFVSGNKMDLYPSRSDYQLFYCCNDYPAETSPGTTSRQAQARTTRHPFPAITYTPTDQLRNVLLNTAGAWPRDPMDTRLMSFVASNTISGSPPNTNPAGDGLLPAYVGSPPAAPSDTDNDGMPDAWEVTKGTNPTAANTNAHTLSAVGYTDLEVYLNELSTSRITGLA